MGKGGAIKKHVGNGLEWAASSDNDPTLTIGGRYITEYQETTNDPFFLSDKIAGNMKGVEARLSHQDGTLANFDAMLQKCANESGGVSWLTEMPDGAKYTAKGGANIIITSAPDGMMSLREGKVTFDVIPLKGIWIKS
ncbi:hypothetical protein KAR91_02150 [Candidatus Pacearchaeota archaeon]|nr:hypothetical protein [Candidatus Pacearchaeota archaeon]